MTGLAEPGNDKMSYHQHHLHPQQHQQHQQHQHQMPGQVKQQQGTGHGWYDNSGPRMHPEHEGGPQMLGQPNHHFIQDPHHQVCV